MMVAMINRELGWSWQGQNVVLGMDEAGNGPPVLFLPALSSISTRREMKPLMDCLTPRFRTISVDWPGFGTKPRPPVSWTPGALLGFLDYLIKTIGVRLHGIVAAGHAASYVLHHVSSHPSVVDRVVLIAPTWRGPLPTMAGGHRPLFAKIRRAVESPLFGPLLYRANVNPLMIRMMAAGHVYSDKDWLSGDRLQEKRMVTEAENARFASAGFVTGALDLVMSRTDFLHLAANINMPIQVVYGSETPRRSRAEIEALSALPGVQMVCLKKGKLSLYEEFPDQVAHPVQLFLAQ
jgi:pimeloyl-ACP methyl ester carboxylesterase